MSREPRGVAYPRPMHSKVVLLASFAVALYISGAYSAALAWYQTGFPVTSAGLKNKAGMNVEPSMRPWKYNGPAPDGWFCTQGTDCYVDPNNPYQQSGPQAVIDREMQLAAQLGVATLRVEFDWPLIEPSQGTYNWSRADYIVQEADKYGLQLQPVLAYTPQWATGSLGNSTNWYEVPPANDQYWTDFVTQVVNRYKNSVHYWEIWNEPDGGQYWYSNVNPGVQDFVTHILKPGYSAIKGADPTAKVIVGPDHADTTWYSAVVSDGGGNSFDIASFHDYSNTALSGVQSMQSWLNANGMGSKPIWIGEYGVDEGSATTSDSQHQALMTTVLQGSGYQQAQWYTLRDELPRSCCPISGNEARYFGVVAHDDVTLKQGFSTMQSLIASLGGSTNSATPTPTAPSPTPTPPSATATPTSSPVPTSTGGGSAPTVMPIISRGLPAFASSNVYSGSSPSNADDNSYSSEFRSSGVPAWVAYDLSSVPAAQRTKVLAVYYNSSYAYNTLHGAHYNNLGAYSIEGNTAAGGGSPPTSGWVSLVSVTNNTLHSRQHVLDLTGYNWVRLNVTASDGSTQNFDADVNQFDLYDLSSVGVPTDDWIFYGDSITAGGMLTYPDSGVPSFAELIHQSDPSRWPVAENGGEPFDTSADGVARLTGAFSPSAGTGYLSIFPGRYVVLSYGMNDAAASTDGTAFYNNMQQMVQAVLAAGKVPVIPMISYTNDSTHNANIPVLNAKITALYNAYPQIVRGPDFWTYFQQNPSLIQAGDIHPTAQGYAAMRQLWAQTMLSEVYSGSGSSAVGGASSSPGYSTPIVGTPRPIPTATSTASTRPTPTPITTAPIPSPSGTVPATQTGSQLIANGGFDSGQTPWVEASTAGHELLGSVSPHSGSKDAQLCGYDDCTDTIMQTVTLPVYTGLTLSYWLNVSTQEESTACYDHFYVQLETVTGGLISTPQSLCNYDTTRGWMQKTVNLTTTLGPYKGKQVKLVFRATNNATLTTDFLIDDVSLTAVEPATPMNTAGSVGAHTVSREAAGSSEHGHPGPRTKRRAALTNSISSAFERPGSRVNPSQFLVLPVPDQVRAVRCHSPAPTQFTLRAVRLGITQSKISTSGACFAPSVGRSTIRATIGVRGSIGETPGSTLPTVVQMRRLLDRLIGRDG
jgi:lysophospholipase L1-like esterase